MSNLIKAQEEFRLALQELQSRIELQQYALLDSDESQQHDALFAKKADQHLQKAGHQVGQMIQNIEQLLELDGTTAKHEGESDG